jgi:hypothetical protein
LNKLYITGDIHGNVLHRVATQRFGKGSNLDRDDFLFFLGDFGIIWDKEPSDGENYQLDWLNDKPWTTFVLGGNHENWDRLRDLPTVEKFGVTLGVIRDNIYFIPNGTVLDICGKKIFVMGGAMSTDKEPRLRSEAETGVKSWWAGEIPTKEEMQFGVDNLEKCDWTVDYMFTHTMPSEYIDEFAKKQGYHFDRIEDPTARYLSFINGQMKSYDDWFCGHFHDDSRFGKVRVVYYDIIKLSG